MWRRLSSSSNYGSELPRSDSATTGRPPTRQTDHPAPRDYANCCATNVHLHQWIINHTSQSAIATRNQAQTHEGARFNHHTVQLDERMVSKKTEEAKRWWCEGVSPIQDLDWEFEEMCWRHTPESTDQLPEVPQRLDITRPVWRLLECYQVLAGRLHDRRVSRWSCDTEHP